MIIHVYTLGQMCWMKTMAMRTRHESEFRTTLLVTTTNKITNENKLGCMYMFVSYIFLNKSFRTYIILNDDTACLEAMCMNIDRS